METLDATHKTLTIAQLPLHATTIRALVKVNGGPVEVASSSPTPTVSLLGVLTYPAVASVEAWVVGHNATGDGPASNHVTVAFD